MKTVSVESKQYIEQREKSYFIINSRVSLDSIVNSFTNGVPPEGIVQSFPVLSLEQIYGAITFYLANKEAVDSYLQSGKAEYQKLRSANQQENKEFYEKLIAARTKNQ